MTKLSLISQLANNLTNIGIITIIVKNWRTSLIGIFCFISTLIIFFLWLRKEIDSNDLSIALGAICSVSVTLNSLLCKSGQTTEEHIAEALEYKQIADQYQNKQTNSTVSNV
jgi:hypothetical protein